MQDLATTARRLRQVKDASRSFLMLWAMDRMASDAGAMARVAADVGTRAATEEALADPHNHNWTLLYRGSVLDD